MRRVASTTLDRSEAEDAMRTALAATRETYPHPNPRVGAVIISPDGDVVALGAHREPGQPHAERLAIDGRRFPDHTMVVTLEPCSHIGRTPPCTEAVIAAGITEVWIGAQDPDARVAGSGVDALRAAGIRVVEDVLTPEVEANDPGYFHHRRTGRARVTLKLASTLDGQSAAADGTSQWITGPEAREDVHRLRSEHDAVMVGMGTVIADDPRLDVRLDGYSGPQPRPVVIGGSRPSPEGAQIYARDPIAYSDADGVDLRGVLGDLPQHGVLSVLVEGGPTLASSLIAEGLVDELVWYYGASLAGGVGLPAIGGTWRSLHDATTVTVTDVQKVGSDIRVTALLEDF